MPWRPKTAAQNRNSRKESNDLYNAKRRATEEPDLRNTAQWQKLRKLFLAAHPLCNDPYEVHRINGETVEARQVDHVIAYRERPDLCFTESNLQGLCTMCHSRKSQLERAHDATA